MEVDVSMNLYMYVFDIMPKEQFYYILLILHYLNFKPSQLEFGDIFHKLHPRVLQAAVWHTKGSKMGNKAYVFKRFSTGNLLLELFLQLLSSTYWLLVPGKVWKLLEPGVCEVLGEMLTTAFVGREQLLRECTHIEAVNQKPLFINI